MCVYLQSEQGHESALFILVVALFKVQAKTTISIAYV